MTFQFEVRLSKVYDNENNVGEKKQKNNNGGHVGMINREHVCFLKRTIGKAMWQTEENRVSGKDTNLDLIRPASVTDALIRQRGNMLFCNTSSYLKPLLLNFTD